MYQVYALKDPRDMLVHYVGIGKDAYKRYGMHLAFAGKTNKDAWMQELRELGLFPVLEILESVETKAEALVRENYWIQHYLNLNAPLTNISNIWQKEVPTHRSIHPIARMEDDALIEEMKEIFKQEGWTMQRLKRRKHTYIYARKRGKKHLYIAPEKDIEKMSADKIRHLLRTA